MEFDLSHLSAEERAFVEGWFAEQVDIMRSDPLNYGVPPHAGQEKVHTSLAKMTLLVSANRWGKTTCGMREALWRARGEHPYKQVKPHDTIWIGCPDYPFFRRVTEPAFRAWIPQDWVIQYHESERWVAIRRADGGVCTIHFLSYDSGRDKWQGAAVDFLWCDEEMPEDVYREGIARLIDRSGDCLLTLTPVSGMGWIYDRLFIPGQEDSYLPEAKRRVNIVEGALAERNPAMEFDVGSPLVPHLNRHQILRFARSIPDEDERAIRIFGQFRSRSGVVYRQYRPEVHVVPAFPVPRDWEVWAGVDPGYHGFSTVFFAISDGGRVYVVDEYFSQEESERVRANAIYEKYKAIRGGEVGPDDWLVLYVDTEDPQMVRELNIWASENSVQLAFKSLEHGKKARLAGIRRVQEMLSPVPGRPRPDLVRRETPHYGEPLLYLFDSLKSTWRTEDDSLTESRLRWELMRYLWKRPPEGAPHPTDADERSAGGAHALAALRYGIMARMGAPGTVFTDTRYETAGRHSWLWQQVEELDRAANGEWLVH